MFQNSEINFPLLIIIGTVTFIVFIIGFFYVIKGYQTRVFQNMREKQELQTKFKQELLQTQIEIQEQTLKNISQEIHDNIGQVLSLVKLNINTMNAAEPGALINKINDSKHLITKAIQDLRDLSKSLNTDYVIESGLIRSIQYELAMIERTGSYDIRFNITGQQYRLEQQQELIFFRIIQEVLHNILKHAKATVIDVKVIFQPELFTLQINDNGRGFDSSQIELGDQCSGLGIRNMRSRASMINTNFKLISNLEKGTTVILDLPLQKR